MNFNLIYLGTLLLFMFNTSWSQEVLDNQQNFSHKNIFRFNSTNPVIFGKRAIIFGYERSFQKHHSFCLNFGSTGFRNLTSSSYSSNILNLKKEIKNSGFHFSTEYRYYIKNENKFHAPRGIYVGPYFSFNNIRKRCDWFATTNTFNGVVKTDFNLNIYSVGVELGYQFILWKRLSIDFIFFGPGIAIFNLNFKTDIDLSVSDSKNIINEFNNFLDNKHPGFKKLATHLNYENGTKNNIEFLSYRFIVHFGYNF